MAAKHCSCAPRDANAKRLVFLVLLFATAVDCVTDTLLLLIENECFFNISCLATYV